MGIIKQMWLEEMDAQGIDPMLEWEEPPDADPLRIMDQNRMYEHQFFGLPMNTDEMEFRYERRGDMFMLKRWYNGTEKTDRGHVDQTPEWLGRILAVSRVGNHIKATVQPPPDEILWFRTDTKRNLTQFIDLEDPK